jgi:hypothetical protein
LPVGGRRGEIYKPVRKTGWLYRVQVVVKIEILQFNKGVVNGILLQEEKEREGRNKTRRRRT